MKTQKVWLPFCLMCFTALMACNSKIINTIEQSALAEREQPKAVTPLSLLTKQCLVIDSVSLITSNIQLVIPPMPWDWDINTVGTISDKQFRFADTIPLLSHGAVYAPSSNSFTNNYRAFLYSINDEFPHPQLLEKAKAKIRVIRDNIGTMPIGWTNVLINGIKRSKPLWDVTENYHQWVQNAHNGAFKNLKKMVIKLKLEKKVVESNLLQSVDSGVITQFEEVEISAFAWGIIPIYPGAWFESSMIQLGRKYVENEASFFGTNGLLRSRVAAFYVVYQPKFKFSSTTPLKPAILDMISKTKTLYAFGIETKVDSLSLQHSNGLFVDLEGVSPYPLIVAVIIETYS